LCSLKQIRPAVRLHDWRLPDVPLGALMLYSDIMTDATDLRLASQYEAYPYPRRDPRDEAKRLIVGSPSHIREIDHWIFGAARPTSRPLNALIAGGGTGDATIMLAQQLITLGRPGRVTWLDRSAAALTVAQGRAQARNLTNIAWEQRSLLDLPGSNLGPFDYIDCCGVLHHLSDPAQGLRALLSVLAPGGGMGLMVYAPHGRTGVYMMQDALRRLAPPDETPQQRLDVARRVMRHLPDTQWLRLNRNFDDHINGGDAGLYDLLLNPRDRAYTVPKLSALLTEAGLRVTCWIEPIRYDPAPLLPDPKLRARLDSMDPTERAALAEALAGNMAVHMLYCVRAEEPIQRSNPNAETAVPVCREIDGETLTRGIRADGTLPVLFDGLRIPVALPSLATAILPLIDGKRSVGEICTTLARRGMKPEAFAKAWSQTFSALERINRVLLAAPG
jgi:SAM-dependent methyltransferase